MTQMHSRFEERVQTLKESWEETRLLSALASHHDRQSQYELLRTMHGWCGEAVAAIHAVYGSGLGLALSDEPEIANARPSFSLAIQGGEGLLAWIEESGEGSWEVAVRVAPSPGKGDWMPVPVPRGRRTWSRSLIEELVLRLLASFERQRRPEAGMRGVPSVAAGGQDAGLNRSTAGV